MSAQVHYSTASVQLLVEHLLVNMHKSVRCAHSSTMCLQMHQLAVSLFRMIGALSRTQVIGSTIGCVRVLAPSPAEVMHAAGSYHRSVWSSPCVLEFMPLQHVADNPPSANS